MMRGDVFWGNLDPVVGSRIGKQNPAVIVQNEAANRSSATVAIIPLSTNLRRIYPFQVKVPAGEAGLNQDSKALCEQIRTLSRSRLLKRVGRVGPVLLNEIREALERHLWI